ncbi:28813_t:CDS:2 [Gigaspora margarita]|uniref:tyrosinase n=1 Tax=Gigaspora margarita TaxID=4874 RepID=A0ABN7V4Q6_GIGMA|nr:28813_t:CDS:2 [Gigaspora margarita]
MGLSHSSVYHSSHVRSVTKSGPVVITPHQDVYPRLEIYDFCCDGTTYKPEFELLVQGYQAMYDRPYEDMRSFYQVAGIHGLPYSAYDGVTGGAHEYHNDTDWAIGRWGGYCHHGDILFPTWHRPYMLLIESLLIDEAKKIALQYPDKEKEKYVEAANKLRHPYWDWSAEKALEGIPNVFSKEKLEIYTPKGWKIVNNPLKSYTLPVDLSTPFPTKSNNPTAKPNYTPPSMDYNPYTPAGYPTVRHPNANYQDQYDVLNQEMLVYVPAVFRAGFYQMFLNDNYLHFSNHALRSNDTEMADTNPGHPNPLVFVGYAHFASIETTHDGLHIIAGGLGGHMSYPDITTFDPLFFFHHMHIDRLLALWQAVWVPESIAVNGTYTAKLNEKVNGNTDLTPFRKSEKEFWNSNDVRDIEKLGYTYPELMKFKGHDSKKLHSYILGLYKPDPHFGRRWFAKLTIEEGKLIGPYVIRVFVDLANATAKTPVTSPHFAGLVAMWRSTNNFRANGTTYTVGSVDITAAMERLGLRMEKHDYVSDVNATTGLLKSTSLFNVDTDINCVPVRQNGEEVNPKDAGVTNVEVYSFEHDNEDPNFLVKNTGQYHGAKKF